MLGLFGSPAKYWARFAATSTQVVATATFAKLSIGSVVKSDAWPAITVPTADIAIPVTGLYLVTISDIDFADNGNGTGYRQFGYRINDNASSIKQLQSLQSTAAGSNIRTVVSAPVIRPLTAGSTFQVYVRHSAGTDLSIAVASIGLLLIEAMNTNPLGETDN